MFEDSGIKKIGQIWEVKTILSRTVKNLKEKEELKKDP